MTRSNLNMSMLQISLQLLVLPLKSPLHWFHQYKESQLLDPSSIINHSTTVTSPLKFYLSDMMVFML
ncbi:hypothetical protein IHE45_06G002200 [Dioscorea alata]|uniref:Uncharacterized protein n=1 Tax=Dioscorea alata TaxID=55571 RepID=A0ACB7VV25_DIOAL|nr:hypothetical protein IHE45_06G002200 [Dioscorea alata]